MAARRIKRTKRRGLSTGALKSFTPKRVLRKWEERDRAWRYCTESLEISIHGHIDYPKDSLFVTVRPDIGLPMTACLTKEHGFEIVRQYCRRLYEELLE